MEKRPLGLFGYSYQVEKYIPNLDFHPHALVFKQLQRFGYAINVEQMPDNPNYLHCTTLDFLF